MRTWLGIHYARLHSASGTVGPYDLTMYPAPLRSLATKRLKEFFYFEQRIFKEVICFLVAASKEALGFYPWDPTITDRAWYTLLATTLAIITWNVKTSFLFLEQTYLRQRGHSEKWDPGWDERQMAS